MKLKEYLDKYNISIRRFSRTHKFEYSRLWMWVKGKPMTFKNAAKIVEITKGEVSFEDLLPDTKED